MSPIIWVITFTVIMVGVGTFIWNSLFNPLFKNQSELSEAIREDIFPMLEKSSNNLTGLAAAAIVLTFSILQGLGSKPLRMKEFLIASWIASALTVAAGVAASILLYVRRANTKVLFKMLKDSQ